jgi:hypothetical protein
MTRSPRILSSILAAIAFAPALVALDSVDDAGAAGVDSGLAVSRSLASEKRIQAQDGGWPVTILGSAAAGWNSNVYASDGEDAPEVDSDFTVFGAGLRLDHYFSDDDRWRNRVEAYQADYSENDELREIDARFDTDYEHLFSRNLSGQLGAKAQRHDAEFIDALGNNLTRKGAYSNYSVDGGAELGIGENDSFALDVFVQIRDYDETDGMNSLDSDKVGCGVKYRHETERSIARVSYDYSLKTYEEELANDSLGIESPSNPKEEHKYHDAMLWLTNKLGDRFRVQSKLSYGAKIDQFENYETWHEGKGELGLDIKLTERWELELDGFGAYRDYPERDLPDDSNLHYTTYGGDAETRFFLTEHLSLFAEYHISIRNTNNDLGLTYRDYTVQAVSGGISAAF